MRMNLLYGWALLVVAGAAAAETAYPEPAPNQRFSPLHAAEEIALARSAGPASISEKAEVRVMRANGYETAVKGTNGFVCLVERSWGTELDDPEFWNPKVRSPMCFNESGASSVLPAYLARTRWVLTGLTRDQIIERTKASKPGEARAGSMCFMMSKQGYLADAFGHAHPHLMFFLPHVEGTAWGANLPGSPVAAVQGKFDSFTTFFVTVSKWSDGTPGME